MLIEFPDWITELFKISQQYHSQDTGLRETVFTIAIKKIGLTENFLYSLTDVLGCLGLIDWGVNADKFWLTDIGRETLQNHLKH